MTNYHLIQVKYVGASNTRGSRVKLTSLRFPSDSVTLSFSYRHSSMIDQALEFLKEAKFKVSGYGYDELKGVYVICSTTFEPIKELKKLEKMLGEAGWHKEHKYINKAEKWETSYKRKTPGSHYKKRK